MPILNVKYNNIACMASPNQQPENVKLVTYKSKVMEGCLLEKKTIKAQNLSSNKKIIQDILINCMFRHTFKKVCLDFKQYVYCCMEGLHF